jgi:hypothetical protein
MAYSSVGSAKWRLPPGDVKMGKGAAKRQKPSIATGSKRKLRDFTKISNNYVKIQIQT